MMSKAATLASLLALGLLACGKSDSKQASGKEKDDSSKKTVDAKKAPSPTPAPAEAAKPSTAPPLPADSGEHTGALTLATRVGSTDTDSARALALDAEGNIIMAGYYKGKNFAGGDYSSADGEPDAFVAKLDPKGAPQWVVPLGGKGVDSAEAVTVDHEDNVLVVGSFDTELTVGDGKIDAAGADDMFIGKFAGDGRRLWVKRVGGKDIDAAHSVVTDAAGNVYVTGVFRNEVLFGETALKSEGDADIFILKYSAAGDQLWVKRFGAIGADYGRDLAIDSEGNLLLLSEISFAVDMGGGPLSTNGNRDIALAKFDKDGNHLWSKSMGNNFDDIAMSLAVDPADNLLITGSFEGEVSYGETELKAVGRSDLFLAKFDSMGELKWARGYGGKDKDWGNSIATDSKGNAFVTGWFWFTLKIGPHELKSKGKEDVFLLKFSPEGEPLWAKSFGNTNLDMGKAVAVGKDDGVVTVGAFNQELDLAGTKLSPTEGDDPKLVKGDIFLGAFSR